MLLFAPVESFSMALQEAVLRCRPGSGRTATLRPFEWRLPLGTHPEALQALDDDHLLPQLPTDDHQDVSPLGVLWQTLPGGKVVRGGGKSAPWRDGHVEL